VKLVLLPGLDGTGTLFDRFVQAASTLPVIRMAFPTDRVLTYDELVDFVSSALPPPPFALLGESFSGPLALRLAAATQPEAVILCASFIRAPLPHRLVATPLSLLLRAPPPISAVQVLLSGGDEALAHDLVSAVRTVDPKVMASRIRMVLKVDTTSHLATFTGRVLYLRATRDRLVSPLQAELLREIRPDAEIAELNGPHLLLQTRPEECWNRIRPFLGAA
jgi:pimeloyl-ACP methyl ester carboxylesterase